MPILKIRVARFFFGHDTKTGKNAPNEQKMYQMVIKYSKSPFQMTIKYLSQSKALQNLPEIWIFGNFDFW
jgi:hypothetical protein